MTHCINILIVWIFQQLCNQALCLHCTWGIQLLWSRLLCSPKLCQICKNLQKVSVKRKRRKWPKETNSEIRNRGGKGGVDWTTAEDYSSLFHSHFCLISCAWQLVQTASGLRVGGFSCKSVLLQRSDQRNKSYISTFLYVLSNFFLWCISLVVAEHFISTSGLCLTPGKTSVVQVTVLWMNEPPVNETPVTCWCGSQWWVWQYLVWWPCGWGGAGPAGRKGCVAEPRRMQTGPWCKGHRQSRCCSPGNPWLWPLPPSLPGPDRTAHKTSTNERVIMVMINSLERERWTF